MTLPPRRIRSLLLAALVAGCAEPSDPPEAGRISEFGRLRGLLRGCLRQLGQHPPGTSRCADGVRLAVDVTLPAIGGEAAPGPFPVVWTHSRYHRNPGQLLQFFAPEGAEVPEVNSQVDANEALQLLVKHGYVVAAVQVRGGGASFGTYQGLFSEAETDDAREMVEWFATQPWSDGNVGMYGGSYLGMTQYMAASEMHPALKAIFPNVAGLDMYDQLHPGGIYRKDMIDHWGGLTRNLDINWAAPPVDEDTDESLLHAAIAEHEDNWDVSVEYAAGRYRDHDIPTLTWTEHGVSGVLDEVKEAGVPAYHWNGWCTTSSSSTPYSCGRTTRGRKSSASAHGRTRACPTVSSWPRTPDSRRWSSTAGSTTGLKGIENGIMDEPPIHYAVMNDPGEWTWTSADRWPVPRGRGSHLAPRRGAFGQHRVRQ